MKFIFSFFPAFISIAVDNHINKKTYEIKKIIIKYGIYTYFINMFCNIAIFFIVKDKFLFYNEQTYTYDFCLKFTSLALLLSVVLPIIFKIIFDNFELSIKVKGKNKNEKNK